MIKNIYLKKKAKTVNSSKHILPKKSFILILNYEKEKKIYEPYVHQICYYI